MHVHEPSKKTKPVLIGRLGTPVLKVLTHVDSCRLPCAFPAPAASSWKHLLSNRKLHSSGYWNVHCAAIQKIVPPRSHICARSPFETGANLPQNYSSNASRLLASSSYKMTVLDPLPFIYIYISLYMIIIHYISFIFLYYPFNSFYNP